MTLTYNQITMPNVRLAHTANYLKDITEYLIYEIKYLSLFIQKLQLIYDQSTNVNFQTCISNLIQNIDVNLITLRNLYQLSIRFNYLAIESYLQNNVYPLYTDSQHYLLSTLSTFFNFWKTNILSYSNMILFDISDWNRFLAMIESFQTFIYMISTHLEIKLNSQLSSTHYVTLWYQSRIYNCKQISNNLHSLHLIILQIIRQLELDYNLELNTYKSLEYTMKQWIQNVQFLPYLNQNLLQMTISFSTIISTQFTKQYLLASDSIIVPMIYADEKPPTMNFTQNCWSFTNTTVGNKINWYFDSFDTTNSLSYQNLKSMFFIINFSSIISKPFLTLYTINTLGTGWYGSKKTFVSYTCDPHQWVLVYWGQDPTLDTSISSQLSSFDQKVQITFDSTDAQAFVSKVGQTDLLPQDLIYLIAFSTNSTASANTVQFDIKQFGYQTLTTIKLNQLIAKNSSFFIR